MTTVAGSRARSRARSSGRLSVTRRHAAASAVASFDWRLPGVVRGGVNWNSGWYGWGMSTREAMAIPAVGRGVGLLSGLMRQMPLDRVTGEQRVAQPRLLEQPDPNRPRAWFVGVEVVDYLIHGNAVCLVTARLADGWPAAVTWLPARHVVVAKEPDSTQVTYELYGRPLPTADVIHVMRGVDEDYPVRGIGIIEQYCSTLRRVSDQEAYEASTLNSSGVPSVAITSPNAQVSQEEIDDAKVRWVERFSGPERQPALLPAGTVVTPLGWSPADSELTAARGMSLTDVANLLNLDGYWLGAPASGLTYRSAGPKYLELLRQTLGPIAADFEGTWSPAWLPRGSEARFRRSVLLQDDLQTMVATWVQATGQPVAALNEARAAMGLPLSEDPSADVVNDFSPAQIVPVTAVGGP